MFRAEGTTGRRVGGPGALPVWTGMLEMVKHRFDKEITALREDAWHTFAKRALLRADTPDSAALYEEVRQGFNAGFNGGAMEAAARILRILEEEDGLAAPHHHDVNYGGVSLQAVTRICDEFGLSQRKGRHA